METLTTYKIRPYQENLKNSCVEALLHSKDKIIVLASEVGSGKTDISISIISAILEAHPDWKVFIVAHNRKDIRNQFVRRIFKSLKQRNLPFTEEDINVVTKKSEYNPSARIVVCLAATVRNLDLVKYNLLVVDESHHNIDGKMIKTIIKKIKVQDFKSLYLTATPDKFVGKKDVQILGFSAVDLIKAGREDSATYTVLPTVEIAEAYKDITRDDYNDNTWETTDSAQSKLASVETARIIEVLLQRLSQTRSWPSLGNLLGRVKLPFLPIGKTLVFANSIQHSKDIYNELNSHYPDHVLMSTSENDEASTNLDKFSDTSDPDYSKYNFLVVVDRTTLAWDFPSLDNIVDISLTLNPSTQKQIFGRLMRPDNGRKKFFMKVTTPDRKYHTDVVMQVMFWLLTPEGLSEYKGLGSIRNKSIIFTDIDVKKTSKSNKKVVDVSKTPVLRFKDPMDYFKAMGLEIFGDVSQFGNRAIETYKKASPNEILSALEGTNYKDPQGLIRDIFSFYHTHWVDLTTGEIGVYIVPQDISEKGKEFYFPGSESEDPYEKRLGTNFDRLKKESRREEFKNWKSKEKLLVESKVSRLCKYIDKNGYYPPKSEDKILNAFQLGIKHGQCPYIDEKDKNKIVNSITKEAYIKQKNWGEVLRLENIGQRPPIDSSLGKFFIQITSKCRNGFVQEWADILKTKRPEWFGKGAVRNFAIRNNPDHHLTFRKKEKYWIFQIRIGDKFYNKMFKVKEEAIEYRDKFMKENGLL